MRMNFGFDSESRLKRYMEEKGIVAVRGTAVSSLRVHVISPTLHRSELTAVCTENIFLQCRLCLLLLGRRGQLEVAL